MLSKQILSLVPVRLASTSGHIILVPANTPTTIPESLFVEAAKTGCVDYNPKMMEAFRTALAKAEANPESAPGINLVDLAREAVKQVLLVEDKALLTSLGVPRVPAVRAAYEVLCAQHKVTGDLKVTPELVNELFADVQKEGKPVEPEQPRYPTGIDDDGEVGGVDDDLLERVTRE